MKKISILACLILGLGNLFAQTTLPASLPINSVAAYKAYALSKVVTGEIVYEMRNAVETNNDWLVVNGVDVTEVMKKVSEYTFGFETTDVNNETVTTTLNLLDSSGYQMFTGTSTDPVQMVAGKATFSPNIELRLSSYVPIDVGPDVTSVQIRTVLENGYRATVYWSDVYNNRAWVPLEYIGGNYEFAVYMTDGNSYVYQDGRRMTSVEVLRANANFKLNNFYEITLGQNNDEFVVPLVATKNPTAPVFKVTTVTMNTLMQVDAFLKQKDGSFERPARAYWFNSEFPAKVVEIPVGLDSKVHTAFPYIGTYYLAIEFQSLESPAYVPDPDKG